MKIISLEIANIKRIRAVHIEPTGNMVVIGGRNRQGKTSTLNSIFWAMQGARNITRSPIRDGEEEAIIRLDLGDIKVTRTFTRDRDGVDYTTKLKVMSADGANYPRADELLKSLWSELSVDPLEFKEKKPAEQYEMLKPFASGVDFEAFQKAHDADYAERTEVGRKAEQTRSQANGIVVPEGTPDEMIDESALVDQIATAGQHNADIERQQEIRARALKEVEENRSLADAIDLDIQLLREKIARQELDAKRARETADVLEQAAADQPDLPEPIDTSAVRAQIEDARTTNANVARLKQKQELERQAYALEAESEALTKDIKKRNKDKQDAIAKAELPVPGLGFGDGFVTMNGQPFEQASDAEQLEASVAIAMAAAPKLKVILVRNGSLMDADAMQRLADIAERNDYQVFVEVVGQGDGVGFIIEDGMVVGADVAEAV